MRAAAAHAAGPRHSRHPGCCAPANPGARPSRRSAGRGHSSRRDWSPRCADRHRSAGSSPDQTALSFHYHSGMSAPAPRVGFVSLGCPKALVDSERILTQLRIRGYEISPSYEASDLVVVNTCGFIDSAIDESLEAIGEAIDANGKVIVTGCLGANPQRILDAHPKVLAVTGPHATEQVLEAVNLHLPRPHDPFTDLVPPQGIRLTPRHYAYLKLSEGCNHRCSGCIIPALRGRLVARPLDTVLGEARRLVAAGVKELLVISQDTSAYGVDLRYQPVTISGTQYETRFLDLARALGSLGVWVRMHYVYP